MTRREHERLIKTPARPLGSPIFLIVNGVGRQYAGPGWKPDTIAVSNIETGEVRDHHYLRCRWPIVREVDELREQWKRVHEVTT